VRSRRRQSSSLNNGAAVERIHDERLGVAGLTLVQRGIASGSGPESSRPPR
jgi:hypothetical protein